MAHVPPAVRDCPPTRVVGGLPCAGHCIPLLARRTFDVENVALGEIPQSIVLAKGVRVNGGQAILRVRVHRNNIGSARTLIVKVVSEAPCAQDPDVDFVASFDDAAVQVDEATQEGSLVEAALAPSYSSSIRLLVDLLNKTASATGGGSVELSADLYVRPGVASPKRRFVMFAYNRISSEMIFVPFREDTETLPPPGVRHSLLMEGSGRVEMVTLFSSAIGGTTTVGVHLNEGTNAVASDTAVLGMSTAEQFFPQPIAKFAAGDRIHVSVDPTDPPGDVVGVVLLRLDAEAGS